MTVRRISYLFLTHYLTYSKRKEKKSFAWDPWVWFDPVQVGVFLSFDKAGEDAGSECRRTAAIPEEATMGINTGKSPDSPG